MRPSKVTKDKQISQPQAFQAGLFVFKDHITNPDPASVAGVGGRRLQAPVRRLPALRHPRPYGQTLLRVR